MNILISMVVLIFSLGGFYFLDAVRGVLWFLFLLMAYPLVLSTTRVEEWKSQDVVSLYKIGISQVPYLGGLLSGILGHQPRQKRSSSKGGRK